jgi:hypothetical protein
VSSIDTALETLEAACETEAPASLMAAHMAFSCTGKLRVATRAGVEVELAAAPVEPIVAGDRCAVTFPLAGRSAGFTARVVSAGARSDGRFLVVLDVPERVQATEQRMSVRVPVPVGALDAAVLDGRTTYRVKALDLSLDGILVEFESGDVPDIAVGQRRKMALGRGTATLVVDVEVRRRDARRFGLYFHFEGSRPREMVQIVSELQRLWNDV